MIEVHSELEHGTGLDRMILFQALGLENGNVPTFGPLLKGTKASAQRYYPTGFMQLYRTYMGLEILLGSRLSVSFL